MSEAKALKERPKLSFESGGVLRAKQRYSVSRRIFLRQGIEI